VSHPVGHQHSPPIYYLYAHYWSTPRRKIPHGPHTFYTYHAYYDAVYSLPPPLLIFYIVPTDEKDVFLVTASDNSCAAVCSGRRGIGRALKSLTALAVLKRDVRVLPKNNSAIIVASCIARSYDAIESSSVPSSTMVLIAECSSLTSFKFDSQRWLVTDRDDVSAIRQTTDQFSIKESDDDDVYVFLNGDCRAESERKLIFRKNTEKNIVGSAIGQGMRNIPSRNNSNQYNRSSISQKRGAYPQEGLPDTKKSHSSNRHPNSAGNAHASSDNRGSSSSSNNRGNPSSSSNFRTPSVNVEMIQEGALPEAPDQNAP